MVVAVNLGSLTIVSSACHDDDDSVMQILLELLEEGKGKGNNRSTFLKALFLSLVSIIYFLLSQFLSSCFPSM